MRRVALCAALVVVLQSVPACAITVTRLFEPTDLELEDPGVAELDLQLGPVRGQSSYRVSMADFEFDLGLTKNIELDLDGVSQPAGGPDQPKPAGFLAGVNLEIGLDQRGTWALLAQCAGVDYWSPDPNQITTQAGLQWSPFDDLDLSIVGLRGWLAGGDQWGVLFGIAPKLRLW